MAVYKVKYLKECVHIMEVEANSKEEARKKYEDFDCVWDYELQGISEKVIDITEK